MYLSTLEEINNMHWHRNWLSEKDWLCFCLGLIFFLQVLARNLLSFPFFEVTNIVDFSENRMYYLKQTFRGRTSLLHMPFESHHQLDKFFIQTKVVNYTSRDANLFCATWTSAHSNSFEIWLFYSTLWMTHNYSSTVGHNGKTTLEKDE